MERICRKTQFCKFHAQGRCNKGQDCGFAHSQEDLQPLPDLRRTKMCRTLLATGMCNDTNCRFAHNEDELQHRSVPIPAQKLVVGKQSPPIAVVGKQGPPIAIIVAIPIPSPLAISSPSPMQQTLEWDQRKDMKSNRRQERANQQKVSTSPQNGAMLENHWVQWTTEDHGSFGIKSTTFESGQGTEASWSNASELRDLLIQQRLKWDQGKDKKSNRRQEQCINQQKFSTISQIGPMLQNHVNQWINEDHDRFESKSTTDGSEQCTEASWSDVSEIHGFRFEPQRCKIHIRKTFLEFEEEDAISVPLRRVASAPASTFFSDTL